MPTSLLWNYGTFLNAEFIYMCIYIVKKYYTLRKPYVVIYSYYLSFRHAFTFSISGYASIVKNFQRIEEY